MNYDELPAHGPACKPLAGLHSSRFPGEPRYVCAANCPRQKALRDDGNSMWVAEQDQRGSEGWDADCDQLALEMP